MPDETPTYAVTLDVDPWWDVSTGEWVTGPTVPHPADPRDSANQQALGAG